MKEEQPATLHWSIPVYKEQGKRCAIGGYGLARRIGENKVFEDSAEASGPLTDEPVYEIDPLELNGYRISDWDGYIAVRALGDDVEYRVTRVIGSVEVEFASGRLSDGESAFHVLDHTHRYRVYATLPDGAKLVIGVRVNFYC